MQAFIALGSNQGERRTLIEAALLALAALRETTLVRASRIIETKPVDCPPESPDFLNAVAELETELSAEDLLSELQRIESELGRIRGVRNAPRSLDLDLLLYGEKLIETPSLVVPHPRMRERLFVLDPLLEIAPGIRDPQTGERYAHIRGNLHA